MLYFKLSTLLDPVQYGNISHSMKYNPFITLQWIIGEI